VHVRRPRLDYESHATGLDRNEVGAMLVQAGLSGARDHALVSLLALNGLRFSEAIGSDIERLGLERGQRTLTILRKGGKIVTIPLAPRIARAVDLAVSERSEGAIFLDRNGERLDRHAAARIVRRIADQAGIGKRVGPHTLRHAFITAALDAGVALRDVQEAASHADPTTMRYDRAASRSTDTPPTSWPPSSPEQPDDRTRVARSGACKITPDRAIGALLGLDRQRLPVDCGRRKANVVLCARYGAPSSRPSGVSLIAKGLRASPPHVW
jgi:hypothetical protein